jgi:hypothetical protein
MILFLRDLAVIPIFLKKKQTNAQRNQAHRSNEHIGSEH